MYRSADRAGAAHRRGRARRALVWTGAAGAPRRRHGPRSPAAIVAACAPLGRGELCRPTLGRDHPRAPHPVRSLMVARAAARLRRRPITRRCPAAGGSVPLRSSAGACLLVSADRGRAQSSSGTVRADRGLYPPPPQQSLESPVPSRPWAQWDGSSLSGQCGTTSPAGRRDPDRPCRTCAAVVPAARSTFVGDLPCRDELTCCWRSRSRRGAGRRRSSVVGPRRRTAVRLTQTGAGWQRFRAHDEGPPARAGRRRRAAPGSQLRRRRPQVLVHLRRESAACSESTGSRFVVVPDKEHRSSSRSTSLQRRLEGGPPAQAAGLRTWSST